MWKRSDFAIFYATLLINYSIYSTYTAKCVGVILVTFLLSYSHLGLYGLHLGLYGLHLGLYGFHLGLYRNPCIWLVRSSVSSVTRERSSWEFKNVGPSFYFGKKCRNRNTTTTTPTFLSGDILTWGHFDCTLSKSSPPLVWGRLSDRTARNGEDMMRILADYLSRYELLTPEKTESVLEEVEDTRCFQFNCHYRMEDRMELFRTTQ